MRLIIIAITTMQLIGCTQDMSLINQSGQKFADATITYEKNDSGKMNLTRNGIVYEGNWQSKKIDESHEIGKIFGKTSKRYLNYKLGRGSYKKIWTSTLTAENSEPLNCVFNLRGSNGTGWCQSVEEKFNFAVR